MIWTILGAGGNIGSHLASHLIATGETVYTPDRDDKNRYRRPLGHVIYAIGLTSDFRRRPHDTVQAHVGELSKLMQQGNFESLLYLSSTRVYWRAASSQEDSALPLLSQDPSDLYNLSKLMGESLCLQDERESIRVVRLSNVVGGSDMNTGNFLPSLMQEASNGRIVLQTSADSAKDYIHIDDVVELLPRIVTSGCERVYNVASGEQISHGRWAAQIAELTGCTVEVAADATKVGFIPIDISRIRAEFDFQPRPVLPLLASTWTRI